MNRSRETPMRSPFTQDNISSSSLEGMERPVRSFKSFIRTVPPHPKPTQKPLPPTPSPKKERPPLQQDSSSSASTLSPTSPGRNSSVTSWKAPAEWYNDSASSKGPLPTPPIPATRTYSPLLPEPSPDVSVMNGPSSWLPLSPPPSSRLIPIYERPNGNRELGPPRSPPKSPLPAPPTLSGQIGGNGLSEECQCISSSLDPLASKVPTGLDLRNQSISPTNSMHTSIASDASTKEKAFASLGINSHRQQHAILEKEPHDAESKPPLERTRADRQYLRGKKLRALNKGSPLVVDSWEDMDMDDRTRQLSFSQDYHDLLADQYQEMNVRAEEVLRSGGPHQVYEAQLEEVQSKIPQDHDLYPQPLSWQKGAGPSPPRSLSQDRTTEQSSSSGQKKGKHRSLNALGPVRLLLAPKRQASKRQAEKQSSKKSSSSSQRWIPEAEVDKTLKDDLRFSMFFPPSQNIKFGWRRKHSDTVQASKPPPRAASPPRSRTPLMRLPGGFAVVRHPPSAPKSEAASVQDPSPTSEDDPTRSRPGSDHSPVSRPLSDYRSSIYSRNSNCPVAPGVAVHGNKFRSSYMSFSQSSGSSSPTRSHPLAQEVPRSIKTPPPPPPPPPPIPYSAPITPPLSPDAWKRLRNGSGEGDHLHRPKFVEKAKEARRRHNKEARQEKLKRSIKVLGPTDPVVAAGYVKRDARDSAIGDDVEGRMPGYMVHGPL